MPTISTDVTGDVCEHHYECPSGHEFSILIKKDQAVEGWTTCVVLDCMEDATLRGDNTAEVSK